MLKVNLTLLPNNTTGKPSEDVLTDAANMAAKIIHNEIEEEFKNTKCNKHPKKHSYINVEAHEDYVPVVSRGNFCCDEFANSIQIKGFI